MIWYAGIGSRQTPSDALSSMQRAATALAKANIGVRTGGAKGADQAFFDGWKKVGNKSLIEVFIPYNGFRGFCYDKKNCFGPPTKEARLMAKEFHPYWSKLGDRGRDFHARNCYQVMGYNLNNPANFILCYTPNGKIIGGTGQALRLAKEFNIPVFNLGAISLDEANQGIMEILNNA